MLFTHMVHFVFINTVDRPLVLNRLHEPLLNNRIGWTQIDDNLFVSTSSYADHVVLEILNELLEDLQHTPDGNFIYTVTKPVQEN
jgi:hypothetical protein